MKILLIRLDKIGDLICSLPVDQCQPLQSHQTTWAISKGLGFITENANPRRLSIELDRLWNLKTFLYFLQFLRTEKFEMAISFQAPWWIHLALWMTAVPKRVGVLSQWHSYLFLNQSLRQKRSLARQHEADYNADLVYFAFDQLAVRSQEGHQTPVLSLSAPSTGALVKYKLSAKKYIVVHPGMAGSALNWPIKNYILVIRELLQKNNQIVLTGTPADEDWLVEIKKEFHAQQNFLNLQNQLKPNELLEILANAKHVLAPSTGVLHLAASLGTPCTGLYSPIQVQHPLRWSARSPSSYTSEHGNTSTPSNVKIFSPEFKSGQLCPARFHCQGEKCIHFFCMEKISVEQVMNSI